MLETFRNASERALVEIAKEQAIRQTSELFVPFSLGSQFDHLIKQILAKLGVSCLVADSNSVKVEDVLALKPTGIILSGGPASVYADTPSFDHGIFDLDIPVLGICLGFQLWSKHIGAAVVGSDKREFGKHQVTIHDVTSPLFDGCGSSLVVLQSHGDRIEPCELIQTLASTEHAPVAAGHYQNLWGVQFHPEVSDTELGEKILENFCFRICGAKDRYPARKVASRKIGIIRRQIEGKKVLLLLSGGLILL
jgi:GMP synthase (glutamine-hydrolysing)